MTVSVQKFCNRFRKAHSLSVLEWVPCLNFLSFIDPGVLLKLSPDNRACFRLSGLFISGGGL